MLVIYQIQTLFKVLPINKIMPKFEVDIDDPNFFKRYEKLKKEHGKEVDLFLSDSLILELFEFEHIKFLEEIESTVYKQFEQQLKQHVGQYAFVKTDATYNENEGYLLKNIELIGFGKKPEINIRKYKLPENCTVRAFQIKEDKVEEVNIRIYSSRFF